MVLKARYVLKKSTLINWINLMRDGKKEFDKKIEKIKLQYEKVILDYIRKNKKIIELDIQELYSNDKSFFHKYFKEVWKEMKSKKIVYNKGYIVNR